MMTTVDTGRRVFKRLCLGRLLRRRRHVVAVVDLVDEEMRGSVTMAIAARVESLAR